MARYRGDVTMLALLLVFSLRELPIPSPEPAAAMQVTTPASLPEWVEQVAFDATAGPPTDKCESQPTLESPGVVMPPSPPSPELTRPDWVAPPPINVEKPQAVDLSAVPLEPLRGDPALLQDIRGILREARERPVRLSFWGASHVAGEMFTGELRRILQDRSADLGHGFVMPVQPWTGYRANDLNLCSGGQWVSDWDRRKGGREDGRFGMAGMSVESIDPAAFGWLRTTLDNPHGRAASSLEVGYLHQPGGGTLLVSVDDQPPIEVDTDGDWGPGGLRVKVADGPHALRVAPKGDGPVRLVGAWLERDGPGVLVDAMGVNGKTASSWLRWDKELFHEFLSWKQPDVAVIAYGTNEANDKDARPDAYAESLEQVLVRFRELMPETPCVLIGPSDRGYKKGSRYSVSSATAWVAAAQRELGPKYGCMSWDIQAATGGPGSMVSWFLTDPKLVTSDLIHFTYAGYRELAQRFAEALTGVKVLAETSPKK